MTFATELQWPVRWDAIDSRFSSYLGNIENGDFFDVLSRIGETLPDLSWQLGSWDFLAGHFLRSLVINNNVALPVMETRRKLTACV